MTMLFVGVGYVVCRLLDMPLNNGDVFAGYVIQRLLGTGGMGDVYLAQHPRLPRQDALKILSSVSTADGPSARIECEYGALLNRRQAGFELPDLERDHRLALAKVRVTPIV